MKGIDAERDRKERVALSSLIDQPGWRYLREYMEGEIIRLERLVLDGKLTIEDYHAYTGELRGVKRVAARVHDAANRTMRTTA